MKRGSGDLSRRQVEYSLAGLSFREFLNLEGKGNFDPVELDVLLRDHVRLTAWKSVEVIEYRFGFSAFSIECKSQVSVA